MPDPIRVLHVFGSLDKGGAESRTMDIYRAIDRNLVQFDFMTHTKGQGVFEPEILSLGGLVYRETPRLKIINFFNCLKAWECFFENHRYRCIHIHMLNLAIPVLLAARKAGINVRICHARSAGGANFPRKLYTYITRFWVRRLSTHRLAVSDAAGKFAFRSSYIVKKNAIQVQLFRYDSAKRQKLRKELGIDDLFVIGHIGRFHISKNHLFMLNIFADVHARRPETCLILVGDGDLRPQIEGKIAEMGLSDKIYLLGVRDDIPDLLQGFDLFLMPSLYEGLPGAALEAQAAGLPCLLSDTITSEAKTADDLIGFLPINKGSAPWVTAILQKIAMPSIRRDTYEEVREAGYDVCDIAKWYENFYIDLVNEKCERM